MRRFFIIGSRGIPARYGGFETFADKLSVGLTYKNIPVYVTCESNSYSQGKYKKVNILFIKATKNKFLYRIINDLRALSYSLKYAKPNDIFLLLGCGIGPFIYLLYPKLRKNQIQFWVNPDGLNWLRKKFTSWKRFYIKLATYIMCNFANKVICDGYAIQDHIRRTFKINKSKTSVIEYGAEVNINEKSSNILYENFLDSYGLKRNNYYLVVARYVPENNFELIVNEYFLSETTLPLVIISTGDITRLFELVRDTNNAKQVIVCEAIYDQDLLNLIRYNCYAFIHGHEVGGTNPSLLEAMGNGNIVLAHDVIFNREVLEDAGIYFSKNHGSLASQINLIENYSDKEMNFVKIKNTNRIKLYYNWARIINCYEDLILSTDLNIGI